MWEQALNPKGSPVVACWEQAFSTDDGKTWETNWCNEFIHDDNCTPRPGPWALALTTFPRFRKTPSRGLRSEFSVTH